MAVKKGGEKFPVEINAFFARVNKTRTIVSIARNITQKKQNEARLQLHTENSPMAVIEWSKDFTVNLWTGEAEKIFGWSSGEALGKNIADIGMVFEGDMESVNNALKKMTDGVTRQFVHENRNNTKDRGIIFCEWYNSSLYNEEGQVVSVLSQVLDVTDRKNTEAKLMRSRDEAKRANRTKSMFLAKMSHEIRTPMNGIIGMADLVLKTDLTPVQLRYLTKIKMSASFLLDIINGILDFSKVESKSLTLESTPFDLKGSIENSLVPFVEAGNKKNIMVYHNIASNVPTHLLGDPLRLNQIILNLVGNAVKFTERGEVSLTVTVEQPKKDQNMTSKDVLLQFVVHDTGVGIPPDRQELIFDPFVQKDEAVARRHGETGLGLTITRQLVELMNGSIRVENTPEHGSSFVCIIPFGIGTVIEKSNPAIAPTPTPGSAPAPAASPAGFDRTSQQEQETRDSSAKKGGQESAMAPLVKPEEKKGFDILLVEDNLINQEVAIAFLETQNHRVTLAQNGLEALERIKQEKFDLGQSPRV